jgi:hypothetical protein
MNGEVFGRSQSRNVQRHYSRIHMEKPRFEMINFRIKALNNTLWDLSFSPMSVLTLVKRRPLEYSNVDILFTLKKVQ